MLTPEELKLALLTKLTVPLWPHAGQALGLSRNSAYEGGKRGDIPLIEMGKLKKVSTAWLRKTVGMEAA